MPSSLISPSKFVFSKNYYYYYQKQKQKAGFCGMNTNNRNKVPIAPYKRITEIKSKTYTGGLLRRERLVKIPSSKLRNLIKY